MIDLENSYVWDCETPEKCFMASFYSLKENKFYDFFINKWQNDLSELIKFLQNNSKSWYIGYNTLKFDSQVLEYIWRNKEKWEFYGALDISKLISHFASNEIENSNYNLRNTYKETDFTFKTLDLPAIWHFFNENRRVSLKQLEFEMRAENIENLDFDLTQDFDEEGIAKMAEYCHNDVIYTKKHLDFTLGNTDHVLYKGKNKLVDREIIREEVGLECYNWDDVKIGAEWNKRDYIKMTGKTEWEIKPTKVNHFYGKKFKQFFPKTVTFQTKELQDFVKKFGDSFITKEKQEFKYTFPNKLTITLAKGGIHSCEKDRYIKPSESELYIQNDIGSQYPNAIRKYHVEPKHLKGWCDMIVNKISRRLNFKRLYKETKEAKYNSLQEMGKLSLNGGSYGRLNTKGDWQEDPCCMLQVTIGCQLEILMIIEALILKDFNIVSSNTDGWDVVLPKERLEEYFNIVTYYEKLIGNEELGNVEYTVFEWIAQTSVNDYLAKKSGEFVNRVFIPHKSKELNDDLKSKGDFEYWKELHKNSSFSIFPLAYQKYFNEGIEPEEFINSHSDIFDFCARSNSGSTYYHEGYIKNESFKLPKLIRYYVSKDGIRIKKIVKESVDTGANDTNVQPATELKTVCNRLPKQDYQQHLDNLNRKWYIDRVKETIYKVENGKKPKKSKYHNINQLDLF